MLPFSIYDTQSGQILRFGLSDPVALLGQIATAGEALIQEIGSVEEFFVDVDLQILRKRPTLTVPAAAAVAVDLDMTFTGIPEGTEVWIDGAPAGVVDATGLVLSFPRAGVWKVRLEPPFPWKIAECEVTVS